MRQKTNDDDWLCPICKAGPMIADYCPSCDRIEYGSGQAADIIDEQKAELDLLRTQVRQLRSERDIAVENMESGWQEACLIKKDLNDSLEQGRIAGMIIQKFKADVAELEERCRELDFYKHNIGLKDIELTRYRAVMKQAVEVLENAPAYPGRDRALTALREVLKE